MDPSHRPSRRLRLLPHAVGWLALSIVLSVPAIPRKPSDLSDFGPTLMVAAVADLAWLLGSISLAGYVLARILEELHLWRTGATPRTGDAGGRDWYE